MEIKSTIRNFSRWFFREESKKVQRTKKQFEYQSDIILKNGIYYTSDKLFERGMFLCPNCGVFLSIDNKFCKNCDENAICIRFK